jgi:ferredoxin
MLDGNYSVLFERSNISVDIDASSTVLEAAELCDVQLPFECRSGVCGQCKTRLLKGSVRMDSYDALSNADRKAGWILACQSHPQSNVVVEA